MKKKLASFVLGMFLVSATAGTAMAANCAGKVTAVEGTSVTVMCDDGKEIVATGKAKIGEKVMVKDDKVVPTKKHRKHKKSKTNTTKTENKKDNTKEQKGTEGMENTEKTESH